MHPLYKKGKGISLKINSRNGTSFLATKSLGLRMCHSRIATIGCARIGRRNAKRSKSDVESSWRRIPRPSGTSGIERKCGTLQVLVVGKLDQRRNEGDKKLGMTETGGNKEEEKNDSQKKRLPEERNEPARNCLLAPVCCKPRQQKKSDVTHRLTEKVLVVYYEVRQYYLSLMEANNVNS